MSGLRQFADIVRLEVLMNRQEVVFLMCVQLAVALGFIIGFGFFIPDISDRAALFLTTGTATNMAVTAALIGTPNELSQGKAEGRLDYFLALPISRELFLLAQAAYVAIASFPALAFSVVLGAWYYDISLSLSPAIIIALPLAMASLAGAGIALGVYSPHPVLTNAVTNLMMFYILLFAPILIPRDQLPSLLQHTATLLPTTYAADAVRGSLTDLPDTHLARSLVALCGFSVLSLGAAAVSIRRRG